MKKRINKIHCEIESVITVDERGQMVLPKDLRDKANIKAGDRLAVVYWERNSKSSILLMKIADMTDMVKDFLKAA